MAEVKTLIAEKHSEALKWYLGTMVTLLVAIAGIFFGAANLFRQIPPPPVAQPAAVSAGQPQAPAPMPTAPTPAATRP